MGIQGLLKALEDVQRKRHVSEITGQRVGIDAFAWLHRAACCCASELAQGIPTTKHIQFCERKLDLLTNANVTPIVVFDGAELPAKRQTNEERSRGRKAAKEEALRLVAEGRSREAQRLFIQAIAITQETAHEFLVACHKRGVETVVAPYEADAQLAYLALSGRVDAVVSEDSDLLVYGCPRVLFKLDPEGFFKEIAFENLQSASLLRGNINFCRESFIVGCVLAGCDYVKSVPGVGIKKAFKAVAKWGPSADKVVRGMMFEGIQIPPTYISQVRKAMLNFLHSTVYDTDNNKLIRIKDDEGLWKSVLAAVSADLMAQTAAADPSLGGDENNLVPSSGGACDPGLDFLGSMDMPDDIAEGICTGRLNPRTRLPHVAAKSSCPSSAVGGAQSSGRRAASVAAVTPAKESIRNFFSSCGGPASDVQSPSFPTMPGRRHSTPWMSAKTDNSFRSPEGPKSTVALSAATASPDPWFKNQKPTETSVWRRSVSRKRAADQFLASLSDNMHREEKGDNESTISLDRDPLSDRRELVLTPAGKWLASLENFGKENRQVPEAFRGVIRNDSRIESQNHQSPVNSDQGKVGATPAVRISSGTAKRKRLQANGSASLDHWPLKQASLTSVGSQKEEESSQQWRGFFYDLTAEAEDENTTKAEASSENSPAKVRHARPWWNGRRQTTVPRKKLEKRPAEVGSAKKEVADKPSASRPAEVLVDNANASEAECQNSDQEKAAGDSREVESKSQSSGISKTRKTAANKRSSSSPPVVVDSGDFLKTLDSFVCKVGS